MTRDPKRLDEILGSLRAGIVAVDGQGLVELQNAEASRILGISARACLGRPIEACLGVDHPVAALLHEALDGQREVTSNGIELPSRLGGEPLLADLAASPVEHSNPPGGAVITLHDRTIGRELEQHIDQATRSEVFARLASGIAHEVRNPLAGIRGAAQLLQLRLEDSDLQRFTDLIRDESDRMSRLLDELSELTRGGELRTASTNLHRVLDDLLDLHSQSDDWGEVVVQREYDPSIPDLALDPDRIAQVFLNLVRNAVQAMGGDGTLVVRTRIEASYHLSESRRSIHMVRVDILDSGPGICAADLPHIFTPFYSGRKLDGTGLGLPIAQHWVVRHGGRIHVSSEEGRGTRVRVLLPLRREA